MIRKTTKTTIAVATALTTLLSATAVFADTPSSNTVQAPRFSQSQPCEAHGWFKSRLDSLVTSGTLNQDQEDAIQVTVPKTDSAKGQFNKGHHYGEFKRGHHNGEVKTVLDGLVKAGTITQAQEDAIQNAITPAKEATPVKVDMKTAMDGLVKDGTITQAQEDAIKSAMTPVKDATPEVAPVKDATPEVAPVKDATPEVAPVKDATPEVAPVKDATPVVTPAKGVIKNILDSLVKAGLITQAQEDTIQNALTKTPKDGVKTDKNSQVKTNTMTQAQEDAIQGS